MAGLAMLFEVDAQVVFASGILEMAAGAVEGFAVGPDDGIREVLLVIEAQGVWVGEFCSDGTELGMIQAKASDRGGWPGSCAWSEEARSSDVHALNVSVAMGALIG